MQRPPRPKGEARIAEEVPSPGALLSMAPPWPREWSQRLGREALRRGARAEVFRLRVEPDRSALRWVVGRRTVLLTPGPAGIWAELRGPEGKRRPALEALRPGDPFAALLREGPRPRGHYPLGTWLDGPQTPQSLLELLRVALGP